eukprot:9159014-Alexandrium_andersonii.AAC.1
MRTVRLLARVLLLTSAGLGSSAPSMTRSRPLLASWSGSCLPSTRGFLGAWWFPWWMFPPPRGREPDP